MSAAPVTAGKSASTTPGPNSASYLQASQRPLVILIFALPLLILYEVGPKYSGVDGEMRITAFVKIQQAFEACRVYNPYLPAMTVVAILLGIHLVKRDSWRFRWKTVAGMWVESLAWGVILIPLNALASWLTHEELQLRSCATNVHAADYIGAIGAGVYEELLFRLIYFSIASLVLIDILRMKNWLAYPLIVLSSGVLFAAYHALGSTAAATAFQPAIFTFRTLAGIYLGIIFLWRGFGISMGSHACYDVLINVLIWAGPRLG